MHVLLETCSDVLNLFCNGRLDSTCRYIGMCIPLIPSKHIIFANPKVAYLLLLAVDRSWLSAVSFRQHGQKAI